MRKRIGKYGRGSGGIVDESLCYKKNMPVSINFDGVLPHWEQEGTLQYVTFRLKDSIPKSKADELIEMKRMWIAEHPKPWKTAEILELTSLFDNKINHILAQDYGECVLGIPDCCDIMFDNLKFYDRKLYELYDFVVMPNHVHMIILPAVEMQYIMKTLKQYTARRINEYLGRKGILWQDEYFDRLVRSVKNYVEISAYISNNPFYTE